ncbi:DUF1700 domain-containing protein [uncultured Lacinutrix sp.]|uniref:HAAS signaling domain-containing protein n=1 Tax=uncultured Lacinutrix sp. TaxID=574032 RepID=UPI00262D5966|nr:DUF1700 domain-containing protein [uncultured Lacinutrix sp.]
MKALEFENQLAKNIYDNYIKRISKTITILSNEDKKEILMEFNSHIYEGLQNTNRKTELESVLKITQDLGNPEEVLKPLIADKKLKQATRTFNPKHIIQAILLNIKNGVVYSVFAGLYLCLFVFGILLLLKIIYPNEAGLFYDDQGFAVLGLYGSSENTTDILGDWFIPMALFSSVALYIIITLLLKTTRKKKA